MPKKIKVKNKYLYHTSSPRNRKSILNNGLLPMYGDITGYYHPIGEYIFLVPAETIKDLFDTNYDDDIWRINLQGLTNTFYIDTVYKHDAVYTEERIPISNIDLIYKGKGYEYGEKEYEYNENVWKGTELPTKKLNYKLIINKLKNYLD